MVYSKGFSLTYRLNAAREVATKNLDDFIYDLQVASLHHFFQALFFRRAIAIDKSIYKYVKVVANLTERSRNESYENAKQKLRKKMRQRFLESLMETA